MKRARARRKIVEHLLVEVGAILLVIGGVTNLAATETMYPTWMLWLAIVGGLGVAVWNLWPLRFWTLEFLLAHADRLRTVSRDEWSEHAYVSTACLHAAWSTDQEEADGLHAYCAGDKKLDGQAKDGGPAVCKWCSQPCLCECHAP